MGSQFVVRRPGNSEELTELARTKCTFSLELGRRYARNRISAQANFPTSTILRRFLKAGAVIKLLTLVAGDAPGHKPLLKVSLAGPSRLFLSTKAVRQLAAEQVGAPLPALGIDVNRLGPFMVVTSENHSLPKTLLTIAGRHKQLQPVIAHLSQLIARASRAHEHHLSAQTLRDLTKYSGEKRRVYQRRKRLLQEAHRLAGRFISAMLVRHCSPYLVSEDLASLTARGSRGALAKAILSMPDQPDLLDRAVEVATWVLQSTPQVQHLRVDAHHTSSSGHVSCRASPRGTLRRSFPRQWDAAPCSACYQSVNTHLNAAQVIRDRGVQILHEQARSDFPTPT
jgi:hypothetical protein